ANQAGDGNFYNGVLDDVRLFLWGDNSDQLGADGVAGGTNGPGGLNADGQNWGALNLDTDNDFIAALNLQAGDATGDGSVLGDGSGGVNDDVAFFIDHWRDQQLLGDTVIGDLNSRQNQADFNYDGITDIADWLILRANHPTPGSLNLGALLNGRTSVPEPSSVILLTLASAGAWFAVRKRRVVSKGATLLAAVLVIGLVAEQAQAAVNAGGPLLNTGGDLKAGTLGVGSTFDGSLFFDIDDPADGTQFDSGTTEHAGGFSDSQNPDVSIRQRNVLPSYVTFGAGADVAGVSGGWNYQVVLDDFDDPNFAPGGAVDQDYDDTAGFSTGVLAANSGGATAMIDLTVGAGAPSDVVIGIYTDNLDSTAFVPTSFRVSNGAESATLPVQPGNLDGDLYFATVTGVSASDVITIAANGAANFNTIGGILVGDASSFVAPPAVNPTLTIDRATGSLTLENSTDSSLDIVAYEILSAAGALDPGSWTSIADSDSNWIEFTAASDRDNLAEGKQPDLDGDTLANGGGQIGLGNAWLQSPTEDVTMRLALADNTLIPVDVIFAGNGGAALSLGDLDGGGVGLSDWNLFKPLFGGDLTGLSTVEAYQAGDFTGDGVVNLADARAFAASFDAANGAGSFLAATSAVPEPASMVLMLLGFVGFGVLRKQRR
ncbi:MAG: PEP-CTERM sorting domain-containing protein, partial [Aeoliella sp.]